MGDMVEGMVHEEVEKKEAVKEDAARHEQTTSAVIRFDCLCNTIIFIAINTILTRATSLFYCQNPPRTASIIPPPEA